MPHAPEHGDDPPASDGVLFLAPGQKRAGRKDVRYRWLAVGDDTGGAVTTVETVVPPGKGSGLHRHHRTSEAFYVLDGALTFVAGGRTVRAEAGAFVYVPRGVVHGFVNPTDEPARMLLVISPSGFEEVYEELTELYRQGQPDAATIRAVQPKHDLEMLERP